MIQIISKKRKEALFLSTPYNSGSLYCAETVGNLYSLMQMYNSVEFFSITILLVPLSQSYLGDRGCVIS